MSRKISWFLIIFFILLGSFGCEQFEKQGCLRFFIDGVPSEEELLAEKNPSPKRNMTEIIQEIKNKEAAKWQSKHPPWEEGKCVICHDGEGGEVSARKSDRIDTLCFKCHEKKNYQKKRVNLPTFLGKCGICHTPHKSKEKRLMREPAVNICLICHPDKKDKTVFVQGKGSEVGSCMTCHEVHASDEDYLLKAPEKEVCMQCHQPPAEGETREASMDLEMMYGMPKCVMCHKKDVHIKHLEKGDAVVSQNEIAEDYAKWREHPPHEKPECKKCHNFSGDGKILVEGGVAKTCMECHDKKKFSAGEDEKIHFPVMMGCEKCHSGHKTEEPKNLKKPVLDLCGQCHKDVADKFSHFPSEKGTCVSCHNPHGKNKEEKYFKSSEKEVCGKCHQYDPEKENPNMDLETMYEMPKCVMCHKEVAHSGKK